MSLQPACRDSAPEAPSPALNTARLSIIVCNMQRACHRVNNNVTFSRWAQSVCDIPTLVSAKPNYGIVSVTWLHCYWSHSLHSLHYNTLRSLLYTHNNMQAHLIVWLHTLTLLTLCAGLLWTFYRRSSIILSYNLRQSIFMLLLDVTLATVRFIRLKYVRYNVLNVSAIYYCRTQLFSITLLRAVLSSRSRVHFY